MDPIIIGVGIGAALIAAIITFLVTKKNNAVIVGAAQQQADTLIKEAEAKGEVIKKDKLLEAKEKFFQLKSEHEKMIAEKDNKISDSENRIKQKERELNQKLEQNSRKHQEYEALQSNLKGQMQIVEARKQEVDKSLQKHVQALEKIAGISQDEAKTQLMETLKAEARTHAQSYINNDDVKGRVIGREGRNIRALEAATGIEIIVDDTPEAIILSGFDPVRRELARLALHQLVSDGRIHPARIEEVVNKVRKQLEEEIIETGKRTCIDLGIHGLAPELIRMVGRMKYRSSYGQNLLQHSREVANLCAIMASELGLNAKLAKRAGLLHDIGKVPDDEPELPHAILGMKLAEKNKENAEVCNAIGAHHDEIEMTSLISPIIQVCDAISGARPGARREIVEQYIKRLKDLEALALSYPGVEKSFAIQAGRELRVIVESEKVSDQQADTLSFDLAQRIQTEMTYPGQVKVTVIREKRAVNYAK